MRNLALGLFFIIIIPFVCRASHLRGGEITVRQLQCGSLNFEITLTIYTNTSSPIRAGGGTLTFGDGSFLLVPSLSNIIVDANFNIGKAVFITRHQFNADGKYAVGYSENNRNGGIVNLQNSTETAFHIETTLLASSVVCNNPLVFEIAPIDKACHGLTFTHNPGAYDLDGDSISYELITPQKNEGTPVDGYKAPNDVSFYRNFNYQKANEAQNGPPVFQIDPVYGTLTWDAPGEIGEYVVDVKALEWRKIDTTWVNLGYVIRDMQILVEDCQNSRPYLSVPANICVKPGDHLSEIIRGYDPESDPVKIEVFVADNFFSSPPAFRNQDQFQSTASPFDTANVKLDWNITCEPTIRRMDFD